MSLYVDALIEMIDSERKENGARREDWERALALVYTYADTEPPVLRYQVEVSLSSGAEPIAAFQTEEISLDFGKAYVPAHLTFHIRDLHTGVVLD